MSETGYEADSFMPDSMFISRDLMRSGAAGIEPFGLYADHEAKTDSGDNNNRRVDLRHRVIPAVFTGSLGNQTYG
jgi:hypothetical protein